MPGASNKADWNTHEIHTRQSTCENRNRVETLNTAHLGQIVTNYAHTDTHISDVTLKYPKMKQEKKKVISHLLNKNKK